MLVMMQRNATPMEIQAVCDAIQVLGFNPLPMPGALRTAIGVAGDDGQVDTSHFEGMAGVAQVLYDSKPYKQVSREWQPEKSLVSIGHGVVFGGTEVPVVAGPCSVEGEEEIVHIAKLVKAAGAVALRGGAYKPRTSPFAFKGLGLEALEILVEARTVTGLPIVTELLDVEHADVVREHADVLQIGARNMQNYALLEVAGELGRPVLLKRGLSSSLDELLQAADYILKGGADVILCERGIRTFETATRFTLDLGAVPWLKLHTHLPVIVDPSHAAGDRRLVEPLSKAAAAVGADGIIVEVHEDPTVALCDGAQSLFASGFAEYAQRVAAHAELDGKRLA